MNARVAVGLAAVSGFALGLLVASGASNEVAAVDVALPRPEQVPAAPQPPVVVPEPPPAHSETPTEPGPKVVPPIVRRPRVEKPLYKDSWTLTGPPPIRPINTEVIRADHRTGTYLLAAGARDGVEVGYEFTVHRGGDYVTTLVVEEVYEGQSVCKQVSGMRKDDVRVGDEAGTIL